MKFWKMLCRIIDETLPDWRDKFLSYKDLKQQLKLIYPKQGLTVDDDDDDDDDHGNNDKSSKRQRLNDDDGEKKKGKEIDGVDSGEMTKEVTDFVKLLEKEIDKFNAFFIDKEEGYIIKLKVLQDKVGEAKGLLADMMKVGREIVDFHGEMVLLENYSALNYTGLVKILKKYDKRSGTLIRSPFIQKVLREPFFRTDVIDELVKECEKMLDDVFLLNEPSTQSEATVANEGCPSPAMPESTAAKEGSLQFQELAEIEYMENIYVKAAISALRVLKEIRSGSSTVSMFSLPPLQSSDLEEIWKKIPVVEQEAK